MDYLILVIQKIEALIYFLSLFLNSYNEVIISLFKLSYFTFYEIFRLKNYKFSGHKSFRRIFLLFQSF
jgi:hypothetical protein